RSEHSPFLAKIQPQALGSMHRNFDGVSCSATSILGSVPYPVLAEERLPPTLQKAGGQSIPVMALGAEVMLILAWPIKEGIINAARVRRPASCRFTARLSRARERAEGKRCGWNRLLLGGSER